MASYSDDFSGTLGAWTSDSGSWTITSGTLRQTTSGGSYRKLRYSSAMDTNDYYCQCTIVNGASTEAPGPFVRGAVSSTVTYYAYIFFGSDFSYIVEITAGAETILATGGSYTAASSVVARLDATGTALTGTRGGAADVSTTDGSLTSGAVGCATFGSINAANETIDLWSAVDGAAPSGQPSIARYAHQQFVQQYVSQRVFGVR